MSQVSNHKHYIIQDPIVRYFSKNLKRSLNEELLALVLFGSRARGDFHEFSDYDFLAIVKNKDKKIKDIIIETEVDTLNEFDKLISCIVWKISDWEIRKNFPISKNILREGVLV